MQTQSVCTRFRQSFVSAVGHVGAEAGVAMSVVDKVLGHDFASSTAPGLREVAQIREYLQPYTAGSLSRWAI